MINICGSKFSMAHTNQVTHDNRNKDLVVQPKLEDVLEEPLGNDEDDNLSEEDYHLVRSSNSIPPKNGFTDEICEKIYQEEIENELFNDCPQNDTTTCTSSEPQGFDARQQKLESLRLDLKFGDLSVLDKTTELDHQNLEKNQRTSQETNLRFDDWTILDCYFGIPLFDAGVNQIICDRMLSNGLWDSSRLI